MTLIQRQLLERVSVSRSRITPSPTAAEARQDPPATSATPRTSPGTLVALLPLREEATRFNNVAAIYAAMQQQGDSAHFREARFASRLDLSA